jgi:hypothetical protein
MKIANGQPFPHLLLVACKEKPPLIKGYGAVEQIGKDHSIMSGSDRAQSRDRQLAIKQRFLST